MDGLISLFEISGDYTADQHRFVMGNIPIVIDGIKRFDKSKFTIEEVPMDLSWEYFWDAYGHKVGKKKMAESAWTKLDDATRIKVLISLPRYDAHLKATGIQKAHATTFINQEYYDNEY